MPLQDLDLTGSSSAEGVKVLSEVMALESEMVENRRWFHAHPELSFQEFNTAAKVVEILKSYGISEIYEGIGKTGVVAMIRGALPGPCIGLRADMDALPLTETADIPYKSQNVGAMHACGHDGHMTGLLATAKILFAEREQLSGSVKLIFQPAEEGLAGAKAMLDDGVLDDKFGPKVDEIYGIHIWSFNDLGEVCCEDGPVMAASDRFDITVKGSGGHGAAPHQTVDAIVETASLITSLQTIVSRNKNPLESGVISCCTLNGGYGYNIICDSVEISGTCRSFTKPVQEMMRSRMQQMCCSTAQMFGGEIDMRYHYGYPATVNSYPECNKAVRDAAAPFIGAHRASMPQKTMGAEDFSFFLEKVPGCFFFVGAALAGEARPHHKSVFDFDERAMYIGASIYVQLVRTKLIA